MNYRIYLLLLSVGFGGAPPVLALPAQISQFPSPFPRRGF